MKTIKVNISELVSDKTTNNIITKLRDLELEVKLITKGFFKRELIITFPNDRLTVTDDDLIALGMLIGTMEGTSFNIN